MGTQGPSEAQFVVEYPLVKHSACRGNIEIQKTSPDISGMKIASADGLFGLASNSEVHELDITFNSISKTLTICNWAKNR
jgi:hypothetical protein